MIKPNWRSPEYAHYPATRIHTDMRLWADSKSQPPLEVVIEYLDGSTLVTSYEPATKEIAYRHEGEVYFQRIDIAKKYEYNQEHLGASSIVKQEKQFLRNNNIPFKKVYIK